MSTSAGNAAISMNPHQLMGAVPTEAHQPVGTQVPEAMPRRLAHPYPADAASPAPTSLATPAPQPSPVPTPLPVTVGPRILMYGQHPPVREPGVRAVLARRGSLYDDDILAAELAELGRAFSKGG